MRKKYKGKNGFTLAELLIVVAIIAVLVAISIPIFTTQLEKAREATDLSDVRSAYAEVMTAAITGDGSITYSKDSSQVIRKADGRYSVIVSPLHQEIDDWQSSAELSIGGVSSTDSAHWIGKPKAKGSCEVSYNPQTDSVTLNWSGTGSGSTGGSSTGGSSGGSGNGGSGTGGAGTGGSNTGGIGTGGGSTGGAGTGGSSTGGTGTGGSSNGGTETGGGSTGETGTGGSSTGGTETGGGSTGGTGTGGGSTGEIGTGGTDTGVSGDGSSSDGFESGDNDGETTLTPDEIFEKYVVDMPTSDGMYERGQLYRYNGQIYICKIPDKYNISNEYNPEGSVAQQFPLLHKEMFKDVWEDSDLNKDSHSFADIRYGEIYRDKKGNYFMLVAADSSDERKPTWASPPTESTYTNAWDGWIPILPDKHNRD